MLNTPKSAATRQFGPVLAGIGYLSKGLLAAALALSLAGCATATDVVDQPDDQQSDPGTPSDMSSEQAETEVGLDLASMSVEIAAEDARVHVERLASDEMDGRLTGTPGEEMATQYVAEAFEELGLLPAGEEGYFQPFEFTSGVSLGAINAFSIRQGDTELEPELDVDWRPVAFSKTGPMSFSDIVFAGYGLVAPEDGDQPAYDSFADLDVAGKWVLALRYLPEDVSPERRQHLSRYSSLRYKAMEALERGAAGIVFVSGPNSQVKDELVPLQFDALVAGGSIHAVSISDDLGRTIFDTAGSDLEMVQTALDSGEEVPGFDLPGSQIGAHFSLEHEKSVGRNVLARLVVGDEPSDQVVVVGAHVDHLGHGEGGDSLARPEEQGQIHYGADDNASGVAGMIEIAQLMVALEQAGELEGTTRDLVFAAWSGEELGLLGSSHFVKSVDLDEDDDIYPEIAAYLNMDMIGRLDEEVALQGTGSSPIWEELIERNNEAIGLPVELNEDTYLPTDATSFYLKGVPILSAFTGVHSEYNTPRDRPETLDYDGLADVAQLISGIAHEIAVAEAPPEYVRVEAPQPSSSSGGGGSDRRVYCGTIPDMTETGGGGVKLSGVAAGGPADNAGVKAGDVVVELAGQTIDTLYDYSRVMEGLKIGEPVGMVVLREDERLSLTITPCSRE